MEPLLKAVNLTQSVGRLSRLQNLTFEVGAGEIVGLAGQSGAGKTTVALVLSGALVPDAGELYFDGRKLGWPLEARRLGIEVITQQPEMVENLDITRNVFLGNELGLSLAGRWLRVPDLNAMDARASQILQDLGMRYSSLRSGVADLSIEQRQLIAIARARTHPRRLIVVDDPGVVLSYGYQQRLLALVRDWQRQGTAVLFASDNVDHLMAVADRILVLRRGRLVGEYRTSEVSRDEILGAMVGAANQQQLTPIIWALDSYYRAREQAEKLYHRQSLLERELESRAGIEQQLIDQLADQINALDRANVALQDAQRRLLTELEQERKRLAREIHDQVIQDLLGVGYQLEELQADAEGAPNLAAELLAVRNGVRTAITDLRHICGTLRPPTIDSLGLGSALQSYAYDWSKRTGAQVKLTIDPALGRLAESSELSIFRIVQEGLNNVRKHAEAESVEIRLELTSPRRIMLSIADDGRGLPDDFDLAKLPQQGHYGVLGITERVALLGGQWRIQNGPEGGALIQVDLPYRRAEQKEE
jgi:signal transduction histidine kinase